MIAAPATTERHVRHVINLIDATRDRAEVDRLRSIAAEMIRESADAHYEAQLAAVRYTMGENV